MKKLVLASAVSSALLAGAVNAATVYEGNGLTYKLKGDWQIQLRKDTGNDQHMDVEFDDLELKNSVTYDLGNGMTAFGQLDFGFKDAAEGKKDGSKLEEAYLGMDFGNVAVAVGKMNYATDEFGVDGQYEDKLEEDRFDALSTSGDDVIRVDAEFGDVTVISSMEIEAEGESSADGESFDLFASTKVAGLGLAVAYQKYDADPSVSGDVDTWGISATYNAGFAKFGVDYSTSDLGSNDVNQYNLIAKVPAGKSTTIGLGYTNVDQDGADDVSEWYANVTYKFPSQKNVSMFAEIADTDESGVDMGVLAGMRIKF